MGLQGDGVAGRAQRRIIEEHRGGRRPAHASTLLRVFTVNTLVFGLAVVVLVASPATISNPIKFTELVVVIVGLFVTLAIDLVLLALVLAPLRRLATLMSDIDPMRPGQRALESNWASSETIALAQAFNEMLERLEDERRESSGRVLAAQEQERLRIARELHDEIGQTLTAVALRAEHAAERRSPSVASSPSWPRSSSAASRTSDASRASFARRRSTN